MDHEDIRSLRVLLEPDLNNDNLFKEIISTAIKSGLVGSGADFSREIGVSPPTIDRWVRGVYLANPAFRREIYRFLLGKVDQLYK